MLDAKKIDPPATVQTGTRAARTMQGFWVRPRQQFRYAFVLVAGGVIAQSVVVTVIAFFMKSTVSHIVVSHHLDSEVGQTLAHAVSVSMSVLMIMAVAFALIAMLVGLKLSHRIYGPMVPFNRHIDKLKEGYYSSRINLRSTDDLQELRDALNSLAEALQARHGSR